MEKQNLKKQIEVEFNFNDKDVLEINNIELLDDSNLLTFDLVNKPYWAKLTKTGKIKKHSLRRNLF